MGLTIYYNGSFNSNTSLSEMIEEVKDIAEIYKWKYHIFETEFPEDNFDKDDFNEEIYGICFSPPESEAVWFSFLSNGILANPAMFQYWHKTNDEEDKKLIYGNFTKTQYAGIEIHKLVIHILKHIGKKYLRDFKVIDEGEYWETGDEKLLEENFKRFTDAIENFKTSLETIPINKGEKVEDYLERLFNYIQSKGKK